MEDDDNVASCVDSVLSFLGINDCPKVLKGKIMLHGPKVLRSATNTTTLGTPSTNIIMEQVDDDDLQALVPPAG